MATDILTALALVLILEGLLPGLAPTAWMKVMQDAMKIGPRGIRIAGIISMVSGALLLNFLK
jgi:uncharacterized protein YjeT (DUF2065 family)